MMPPFPRRARLRSSCGAITFVVASLLTGCVPSSRFETYATVTIPGTILAELTEPAVLTASYQWREDDDPSSFIGSYQLIDVFCEPDRSDVVMPIRLELQLSSEVRGSCFDQDIYFEAALYDIDGTDCADVTPDLGFATEPFASDRRLVQEAPLPCGRAVVNLDLELETTLEP